MSFHLSRHLLYFVLKFHLVTWFSRQVIAQHPGCLAREHLQGFVNWVLSLFQCLAHIHVFHVGSLWCQRTTEAIKDQSRQLDRIKHMLLPVGDLFKCICIVIHICSWPIVLLPASSGLFRCAFLLTFSSVANIPTSQPLHSIYQREEAFQHDSVMV